MAWPTACERKHWLVNWMQHMHRPQPKHTRQDMTGHGHVGRAETEQPRGMAWLRTRSPAPSAKTGLALRTDGLAARAVRPPCRQSLLLSTQPGGRHPPPRPAARLVRWHKRYDDRRLPRVSHDP